MPFSSYKPSIIPPATDYPTKWNQAMDELDSRFDDAAAFGGTLSVEGVATFGANIIGPRLAIKDNRIEEHLTNATTSIVFNYSGYADGITQFRDFVVYDGKNAPILSIDGATKAAAFSGAVSTGNPLTAAGVWKLGGLIIAAVTLDTAHYVEVMIDGVIRKLLIAD